MGKNGDMTLILGLLGLGYLLYKARQITEPIEQWRRSITDWRSMLGPWWIPPTTWTPIPGPAAQPRNGWGITFIGNGKPQPGPAIPASQDYREAIAEYKSMAAAAISRAQPKPAYMVGQVTRDPVRALQVALASMAEREPR